MKAEMLRIALGTPILAGLSEPLRDRVLEFSHTQDYPAGSTIFLQGEPALALYVVIDGWVKLYRIAPSGAEAVVMVVTRGRTFGEAVALRDLPYPVSAEATTDTTLLRIDAARLRRQMREEPELAIALLASTYVHLQALVSQVEQLKARSGVQRVAEFLVDLAACEQGGCSVSMPYNKTLIAGRLGMKPESLSRAFGRLRDYGVRVESSVAHIDDLDVLRDLTNEDPGKAWMK
ncbi:Crp/Fnr family transcriptional regulator [Paracoccus luteus]|uniref:Crp/Fnr family transcriptional regulator n=1 Tax=Paracoccus luteus TaxID=2508543 RepID=UPI00106F0DE0|nr:cyclic nucleotide-binding domain-containing protein [Paracoccus luteus]